MAEWPPDPEDDTGRLGPDQPPTEPAGRAWSEVPPEDTAATQYSAHHDGDFRGSPSETTPIGYTDAPAELPPLPWYRRPGVLFAAAAAAAAVSVVALVLILIPADDGNGSGKVTTTTRTTTATVTTPVTTDVDITGETKLCDNGDRVPVGQDCPTENPCPDGTVELNGDCVRVDNCENGTTATSPATCVPPEVCDDGTTVTPPATCVRPEVCYDETTVTPPSTCDPPPQLCDDGTTVVPPTTCPTPPGPSSTPASRSASYFWCAAACPLGQSSLPSQRDSRSSADDRTYGTIAK